MQDNRYNSGEDAEIDWYLFFDLLQVSKDIIELTNETDIIILIGDTPSYLDPFLEGKRKIFHLAFSNKPFGCFNPPYSLPFFESSIMDVYVPTVENLNKYFGYLDNETNLTRELVRSNWNDIILVDSSSGQSITGVSIFFNRYIGNIGQENNSIDCSDITGAKPMQFIKLTWGKSKTSNLSPAIAKEIYPKTKSNISANIINYRPDLIIYIGSSIFFHRERFMLYDAYPRILPFYSVGRWGDPPTIDGLRAGFDNIKKLKFLLDIYTKTKQGTKLNNVSDILFDMQLMTPQYNSNTIDNLGEFFDEINLNVLAKKYQNYFD